MFFVTLPLLPPSSLFFYYGVVALRKEKEKKRMDTLSGYMREVRHNSRSDLHWWVRRTVSRNWYLLNAICAANSFWSTDISALNSIMSRSVNNKKKKKRQKENEK